MSRYRSASMRQPHGFEAGNDVATDQPPVAERRERGNERQGLSATSHLPVAVKLFLIGLLIPWIIPLGPLNLSVYRIVLLFTLLPSVAMLAQGKVGPVRPADFGLLLYSVWLTIALGVAHGLGVAAQSGGMMLVDGMGAYLLARCYIRNIDEFRGMIVFVVKLLACLAPFALYEWLTGQKPLLVSFGMIFPTVEITKMVPRMGLWRVQGPFSHSILFGVFCGSMFALTALASSDKPSTRRLLACLVCGTAIMSMSSAPIAGIFCQLALLAWDKVLGNFQARWKLLWGFALAGYLVIEFGSNQTPIQFYISHFTFDQQTGWYRIWIWNYGSASVDNNPIFGIGMGDWVRPSWMGSESVDNFWLLTAMRYGLPAFILLSLSLLSLWGAIALRKGLDQRHNACRTAYLICMATFVFVGSTVHFWGATYAWLFFLAGAGVWLLDTKATASSNEPKARSPRSRIVRQPRPQASRTALVESGHPRT